MDYRTSTWPHNKVEEQQREIESLRQQVKELEYERDDYQRIAHEQYTEWQNDIEKLAASEKELAEANEWSAECERVIEASNEREGALSAILKASQMECSMWKATAEAEGRRTCDVFAELHASQAREKHLRNVLKDIASGTYDYSYTVSVAEKAISTPGDTSACDDKGS